MQCYFVMNFQKYKPDVQKVLVDMTCPVSVLIQKHKILYIESKGGLKEDKRLGTNQEKVCPLGYCAYLQLMLH